MHRPIRFRYWNGGAMVYEDMPLPDPTWILHNKMYKPYGENVLMQFTGLLDKNGKEIYEGDIIKRGGGIVEMLHGSVFNDVVVRSFFKERGKAKEVQFHEVWEKDTGEIIGNIYENPELLK